MAASAPQQALTKNNLAAHDELLQHRYKTKAVVSWVERVITEERRQQFCSQLGVTIAGLQSNGKVTDLETEMSCLDQQISSIAATGDLESTITSLKFFEHQPPTCLEGPLERFLTPGANEAVYLCRPALARVGIQFGSMEGSRERMRMAHENVELARNRAHKINDEGTTSTYTNTNTNTNTNTL